jgi:mannose-6-phosphate isomerase-like protein (cupin superfamily)
MMQHIRIAVVAMLAFAMGMAVSRLPMTARAAAAPLQPATIDLESITPDAMPTPSTTFPNLRSKTFVAADGMTAALQIGTVAKHYHSDANEVQIVLVGTGSEWLADHQVALKPGMMIVIPKGTNHGGTVATSGQLTLVSIKTPPQDPADVHFVP